MEFFHLLSTLLFLSLSATSPATAVHGNLNSFYWNWGPCPNVVTKDDFGIEEYAGTWYQIARYPAFFQSDDDRCTQAVYSPSEKGDNYINVVNQHIAPDGSVDSIEGEAWIPDPSEPGKLLLRFSEYQPAGDYWVLDTDYDLYSLVHTCSNFPLFHTETDWILSRQRTLTEDQLEEIYATLQEQGVSTEPFIFTDQTNCPSPYN